MGNCHILVGSSHFLAWRPSRAHSRNGYFRSLSKAVLTILCQVRGMWVPGMFFSFGISGECRSSVGSFSHTTAILLDPRQHLAMSGAIVGCHTNKWGMECGRWLWHQAGGDRGCCWTPYNAQHSPQHRMIQPQTSPVLMSRNSALNLPFYWTNSECLPRLLRARFCSALKVRLNETNEVPPLVELTFWWRQIRSHYVNKYIC